MFMVAFGGTVQLKDCLNERADDSARLLLVVSPTCADCLAGVSVVAAAAHEVRATRVRLLALWCAMRPGDCEEAAARTSEAFSGDSGFCHFWGRRLAGLDGPSTTSGLGGVRPDTERVGCLSVL